MTRLRRAAFFISLAALWCAALKLHPPLALRRQAPAYASHIVDPGEALLHRAAPGGIDVSASMPLATLSAAVLANHVSPSRWAPWSVFAGYVLLLPFTAACLLPRRRIALAALCLPSLAWLLLRADSDLQSLFALYVALSAGLLAWRAENPTPRRSAAVGLALASAMFYRSSLVFFPPLLVLFERVQHRGKPAEFYRRHAPWLGLAPYALLPVWIAVNWIVHHQFIPLEHGEANSNIVAGALGLVQTIHGDWQGTLVGPAAYGSLGGMLRWAASAVFAHPVRYLMAYLERMSFIVVLKPGLFALAAAAAWLFRASRPHRAVAALALYFILIHCVMAVQENYFMPLWPLLWMLAGSLVVPPAEARESCVQNALLGALGLSLCACLAAVCVIVRYAAARAPSSPAALEAALAAEPGDAWLRFQHGMESLRQGRVRDSVPDLAAAARAEPDRREWAWWLCAAGYLAGDAAAIERWSPEPGDGNDNILAASLLKASALVKSGRREAAREQLARASELLDKRRSDIRDDTVAGREAAARMGSSPMGVPDLLVLRSTPDAERLGLLRELTTLEPRRVGYWLQSSDLAAKLGRRAEALSALGRARKLAGVELLQGIAARYRDLNDCRTALAILERLPDSSGARADAAACRARLGDKAGALASLEAAARLASTDEDLLVAALRYQDLKAYASALDILRRLVLRNPRSAVYLTDLGVCEALSGQNGPARDHFLAAIEIDPSFLPAYLSAGSIATQAEAPALYERALSSPGFDSAEPALKDAVRRAREQASR